MPGQGGSKLYCLFAEWNDVSYQFKKMFTTLFDKSKGTLGLFMLYLLLLLYQSAIGLPLTHF